jgi:hypothetical protein
MLVQVLQLPDGVTRAIYRLLKQAYWRHNDEASYGFQRNKDGKDAAAHTIIADNPDKSIRVLVGLLSDAGIKRGKSWVSEKRMELRVG